MGNDEKAGSILWSPAMYGFLLLWIGEIASLIGSGMTCFAQSVYVYTNLGGTIMNLTFIAVLAQVPGILISPIAGVLVDRWDRRWVMIIGNSVAALATLTLRMLIVTNHFQIWHIYIIVIIISMANHFQWPAYFSTIPLMVPRERLKQANGLVQMGRSVGWLAAPITAGIAVTHFKMQGIVLFDMCTYLFALTMILIVKIPKISMPITESEVEFSFIKETMFGWKYLVKRVEFRSLLIFFGFTNFLFAGGIMLVTPLILTLSTPKVLGSVFSIEGLSLVIGGLLMTMLIEPRHKVKGIVICVFLQGLAFMVLGFKPLIGMIIAGLVLFNFVEPFINAYSGIIWHKKIPLNVQGRVLAASNMIGTAGLQSGYLTGGLLAQYLLIPLFSEGGAWVNSIGRIIGVGVPGALCTYYIFLGFLTVLMACGAFFYRPLRELEDRMPDTLIDMESMDRQVGSTPAASTAPICGLSAK